MNLGMHPRKFRTTTVVDVHTQLEFALAILFPNGCGPLKSTQRRDKITFIFSDRKESRNA